MVQKSVYVLAAVLTAGTILAYLTRLENPMHDGDVVRPKVGPIPIIADVGGRVRMVYAREGDQIHTGDPLIQLDTRDFLLKQRSLERRIHFTELRLAALRDLTVEARRLHSELATLYQDIEQNRTDLDSLTITAPNDGRIISFAAIHPGEILSRGTALAIIVTRVQ